MRLSARHRLLEPAFVGSNKKKFDTEISSLTKEERYVKTLTDRISKKIINKILFQKIKQKKSLIGPIKN